jgi:hypothetical protein
VEEYPSQLLPFKHGLLNYDWAPVLHIGKFDREMYITGRQKFSGIYDLIRKGDEGEKQRKAEAKAKKRKARKEDNEKARVESRGRKIILITSRSRPRRRRTVLIDLGEGKNLSGGKDLRDGNVFNCAVSVEYST